MVSTWLAVGMAGAMPLMTGDCIGIASRCRCRTGRPDMTGVVSWMTTTETWKALLGR